MFERRLLIGRERDMSIWMVPQALGNSEFWTGIPSKREFLAMVVLGILHGVTGELQRLLYSLETSSFALLSQASSLGPFPPRPRFSTERLDSPPSSLISLPSSSTRSRYPVTSLPTRRPFKLVSGPSTTRPFSSSPTLEMSRSSPRRTLEGCCRLGRGDQCCRKVLRWWRKTWTV